MNDVGCEDGPIRAVDPSATESLLDRGVSEIDPRGAMGTNGRRGLGRKELVVEVLAVLERVGPRGATKDEIVTAIRNTSPVSVQRALKDLREIHGAKIEHFGHEGRWRLMEPFRMPLLAPDRVDLVAAMLGKAALDPFADPELRERMRRLVEDLDESVRMRESAEHRKLLPIPGSVSATLTLGTQVDANVLWTLLETCRRKAVRIEYASPWKPLAQARKIYDIEPWAVRVADGAAYLRAWRRDVAQPRSFRIAQIETVKVLELGTRGQAPRLDQIWGDDERRYGIDVDRPDIAVIRLRGAVARWVKPMVWHPAQEDRWIIEGELLERRLAYSSCRELARRIASVLDGVVSIAPEALRAEVAALVANVPGPALERETAVEPSLPGVMYRVPPSAATRTAKTRAADAGGEE